MIRRVFQLGFYFAVWAVVAHTAMDAYASLIVPASSIAAELPAPASMSPDSDEHRTPEPTPEVTEGRVPDGAIPGTGGPVGSVTTTMAGHAAIVTETFAPIPPLVARVLCDSCPIWPNPPPTSLLRPPRFAGRT